MARSVVSVEQIRQFKASFVSYGSNSEAVLGSFREKVASMLSDFEDKLDELEDDMDRKEQALDRCEWSHRNDDGDRCSSQRSAYYRAQARYSSCLALVQEARNAIAEFDAKVDSFRTTKANLVSRASAGLDRVEELIGDYSSGSATQGTSGPGGQISIPSGNEPSGEIDTEAAGMQSAIHITGGDQIAYVLPKGSGTDPVVIDPEAMAHKFDSLPPVQEPDPQTMRIAATGIITLLAAGGLAVGSREMLLQQKTDEIFQQQYGISRTELLIGSGPKQKEYVDAYNRIHKGLQQEIVEIKKEEVSNNLNLVRKQLESESQRDTLLSIEHVSKLKTDEINLQNQLASLEDGKRRQIVQYPETYVAGLSERGLDYMMNGMSSMGRFAAVLNTLSASDYKLVDQVGATGIYRFSDGKTLVEIEHDGSAISFIRATNGVDANVDFSLKSAEIQSSFSIEKAIEKKPHSPAKPTDGIGVGLQGSYTPIDVSVEAWNYEKMVYQLTEQGGIMSSGLQSRAGLKVSAGAEGGLSADVQTHSVEVGGNIGAGASVAEAAIKGEIHTRPVLINGNIVQVYTDVAVGADAGCSAAAVMELTEKGFHGKAGISAGIKAGGQLGYRAISLNDLPQPLADKLSKSIPPAHKAIVEDFGKALEYASHPYSSRPERFN